MTIADISRFVLRHRKTVILFWLVLAVIAVASVGRAVNALDDGFELPGSESTDTNEELMRTFGTGGISSSIVAVLQLPEGTTIQTPGVTDELDTALTKLASDVPGVRIASWLSTQHPALVSEDGRTTYALIYVPASGLNGGIPRLEPIEQSLSATTVAGTSFQFTGFSLLEAGGEESGDNSALIETLAGGLGALIVLLWAFGSFLAILPVLMAAISIVTTFLVVWGLTTITDVSAVILFLISLIGLGIAIDYSLLVVTRWREERAKGIANDEAVQRAMETAGHAVIFSGTAVGIGLIALAAIPIPLIRSIGIGGMLIPLVSVIVSITLLPALLATIGPRMDWPRLRRGDQVSPFWHRAGEFAVKRRWVATVIALVVLAALTIPALSIKVGQPGIDSLASSGPAHDATETLEQSGLPVGALTSFEIVARDTVDLPALLSTIEAVDGIAGAIAPDDPAWRRNGNIAITVIPEEDANNSNEGRALLTRIRDAIEDEPAVIGVGGSPAVNADFITVTYRNVPLAIAIVVVITFLLLVRAFRSLLLPLKAIVLNVLSIGAAYGVIVMIWQWGWGSDLIGGTEATGAITNWLPIAIFSFLFGISMDYEVFTLARMREEYELTGDTNEAVIRGMSHTGRLVTTAAIILGLAFVALGAAPGTTLKIMATGLAAGIVIDATIVRGLLVPAMVSLMGKWNWWLPSWLGWIVPDEDHSIAIVELL